MLQMSCRSMQWKGLQQTHHENMRTYTRQTLLDSMILSEPGIQLGYSLSMLCNQPISFHIVFCIKHYVLVICFRTMMNMATLQDQNPKNDGIKLDAPIKTLS